MARPTLELITALRSTATRLAHGAEYKWSNFACCNCGNLVQSVTKLTPREIYEAAFARAGDWGEQALEFCPSSGYPIDYVLERLFELGLSPEDVRHLERLSDDRVLRALGVRELCYTRREDVIQYMRAWASLLARQLAEHEGPPLAEAAE